MGILVSGKTDIGRKRATNQDSICINTNLHYYAVADGMGGHKGGDIASKMCIDCMQKFLYVQRELEPLNNLENAVISSNNQIFQKSQENEKLKGMGTTLSGVLFTKNCVYISNIGDSRTYLINRGEIFQLTRDHSLIQEKLNLGLYTREQAAKDKMKNVLVRTMGFEQNIKGDIYQYRPQRYDLFLICSDGLHGKMTDNDILQSILSVISDMSQITQQDLDQMVEELVQTANDRGGEDNISVIIAAAK